MLPKLLVVQTVHEGFGKAKEVFYKEVDKTTVLFLSGGKTPKDFFSILAKESRLHLGGVALVDERFGPPMHEHSNEKLLRDTGLLSYFEKQNIPFYPILQKYENIQSTALQYDETVRFLLRDFKQSVAILGVGQDGHTAGIPSNRGILDPGESSLFVKTYNKFPGPLKERISFTFAGLSMFDLLLVLVFGKNKKKALDLMFAEGSEEEIPARFFLRPDIAPKTIFITDQEVVR